MQPYIRTFGLLAAVGLLSCAIGPKQVDTTPETDDTTNGPAADSGGTGALPSSDAGTLYPFDTSPQYGGAPSDGSAGADATAKGETGCGDAREDNGSDSSAAPDACNATDSAANAAPDASDATDSAASAAPDASDTDRGVVPCSASDAQCSDTPDEAQDAESDSADQ